MISGVICAKSRRNDCKHIDGSALRPALYGHDPCFDVILHGISQPDDSAVSALNPS